MRIQLNEIASSRGLDIVAEISADHGGTGYVLIEVEGVSDELFLALCAIPGKIKRVWSTDGECGGAIGVIGI